LGGVGQLDFGKMALGGKNEEFMEKSGSRSFHQ
jgi:hypothetical protein